MRKLLFTDLLGTLICRNSSDSINYYNYLEKEINLVSRYINSFLREGNDIVIITEPGAHNGIDSIFNNVLIKLNSNIDDELRSHIFYYMVGKIEIRDKSNIRKEEKNGRISIENNSIKCIYSPKKEDAVIDFIKNYPSSYYIYGIGDSSKDIPMLLRIQEIGGKSSFMDLDLYRFDATADEIIERELDIEFLFELRKILNIKRCKGESYDIYSEEELALLEKRELRKEQLYKELYNGSLNLDEINRKYSIHTECDNYYYQSSLMCHSKRNGDFYDNYPFNDNLVDSIMGISCYSSFKEYYTRVLKK